MSEIALRFTVELLEDTHTGTGLGYLGLLDDTQSRDRFGRPVIWASTFRGLLREAARDWSLSLRAVNAGKADTILSKLCVLLGDRGDKPAGAVVRSLRLDNSREENLFHVWASTARKINRRQPDDHTLRFIEFARAGLRFKGEIRLPGDSSDENADFLKNCLRRVTSLGGSKTRGWGQVRINVDELKRVEASTVDTNKVPTSGPVRLRLLLQNLEPLNLARTAFAGNLIAGQSFIPGSSLRGSLLHWLHDHGKSDLARGLAESMHVGNAYILPDAEGNEGWERLEVLPLPISLKEPKRRSAEETASFLFKPTWDSLAGPTSDRKVESRFDKRIKTEEYLARQREAGLWRRVRPALGVLLRNSVPETRLDGIELNEEGQADGALFSEVVLREDQRFISELWFEDAGQARAFLQAVAGLLGDDLAGRSWLKIGRKGRPVQVCDWNVVPSSGPVAGPEDSLTLTLTSDLIARTPWLTFRTTLDLEALQGLLTVSGITPPRISGLSIGEEDRVCESVEVHGYNNATGLPRTPALALKRGSVVRIRATGDGGRENLKQWRDLLQHLRDARPGLGERMTDGFGRYVLDLDIHDAEYWAQVEPKTKKVGSEGEANWREVVLEKVEKFLGMLKKQSSSKGAAAPTVSQWQWVRNSVKVLDTLEKLTSFLDNLQAMTRRLGAEKKWEGLVGPLVTATRDAGPTPERQRYFLDMLVQTVVADLKRKRGKEGGE